MARNYPRLTRIDFLKILANASMYRNCIATSMHIDLNTRKSLAGLTCS